MKASDLTFNKHGQRSAVAHAGNGIEISYYSRVEENRGCNFLNATFYLHHFGQTLLTRAYLEALHDESEEDIANIISQFSSEFVEDEAASAIESIQKEFTPGVTRVIGNLTKRIAELEHAVKTLVQVTGGGY